MPIVVDGSYGCVVLLQIIPISKLPYKPEPQYSGNLPNNEIKKVATPRWLSSYGVSTVAKSLRVQGLDPADYITPSTVHGMWKVKKHQGIVYSVNQQDITHLANPEKPIPSSIERQQLINRIIDILRPKPIEIQQVVNLVKNNTSDSGMVM